MSCVTPRRTIITPMAASSRLAILESVLVPGLPS